MDAERLSIAATIRLYRVPILFGGISFLLIVLSLVLLVKSSFPSDSIQFFDRHDNVLGEISNMASESAITSKIYVDVEGAVVSPGVITVQTGDRVGDALEMVGGLRKDADSMYVSQSLNKAMKLVDGMKIYIPSVSETSHNNDCSTSGSNKDVVQSCDIGATLGKSSQNTTAISINMASKEQLERLPGVGPVTAQKIIDNRPYQTLEELVSKKAVGQSVFEKIRQLIDL